MYIIDKIISFFENLFGNDNSYNSRQNSRYEDVSVFEKVRRENGVNGKIDEPVYQGSNGDCWLLSGLLSMSYSKNGAEKFKDSIDINTDGSVDLYFEGIDKSYNISKKELEKNNKEANSSNSEYSTGDDDMLALELAVDKIISENSDDSKFSIKEGGNPYYLYKLYNADNISVPRTPSHFKKALDYAMTNPNECAMTFGVVNNNVCGLKIGHSYAVKSVDDNFVKVVDPWNSTKEIKIDKNEFINNQSDITMVYAEFDKKKSY